MKDYCRRTGKYVLPRAVYLTTLWQIRDYYRMKEEAQAILDESPPPPDGMPKGTTVGDMVFNKAVRREQYISKTRAIEETLLIVPKEYRRGVWCNIMRGDPFPLDAHRGTYSEWKSKYIHAVAVKLEII